MKRLLGKWFRQTVNSIGLLHMSKKHENFGGISNLLLLALLSGNIYANENLPGNHPTLDASSSTRVISRAEVAKHKSVQDGIWVISKGRVFDVTTFVANHPGGNKILLAAGGEIDPYWKIYDIHNKQSVREILNTYFIGNLDPNDILNKGNIPAVVLSDAFRNDPERHPALIVGASRPFNAEPPASLLLDQFHTPSDIFFKRNHLPVPLINLQNDAEFDKSFKLTIDGLGILSPVELTLHDLKTKFEQVTIGAVLQCGGNRRGDMSNLKETAGLKWKQGAISNAKWTGVRLIDVLKYSGLSDSAINDILSDLSPIRHIQFDGLDGSEDTTAVGQSSYGASIPACSALNPRSDVIIAYAMNGNKLCRDHGFPLRVIVPGVVAARSVKWLNRIHLSSEESSSHWQQRDYKIFPPSVQLKDTPLQWDKQKSMQQMPVQSAICVPDAGELVSEGEEVTVKGYAYSGGGSNIVRVDVSCDDGETWLSAELCEGKDQPYKRAWEWTFWKVDIPFDRLKLKTGPNSVKSCEILCKATDISQNSQPETIKGIWNVRGFANNSWHRVKVDVKN